MQRKALVVINISREQPGTILEILKKRDWLPTFVDLEHGEQIPSPKDFDALIVMGGTPSANDTADITPWMPNEILKIQEALKLEIPYLGVCLGLQTLVKAAGGVISKSPRKEVGFRESYKQPLGKFYSVQLTEEGKKDPFLKGLPDTFPLFHLHGEAVALSSVMNPAAILLGTAEVVLNQIVKVGKNAYGTQGHFELTPEMLDVWLKNDSDLLELEQEGREQVRKDFQELQSEYTQTAKQLYNNFFDLVS